MFDYAFIKIFYRADSASTLCLILFASKKQKKQRANDLKNDIRLLIIHQTMRKYAQTSQHCHLRYEFYLQLVDQSINQSIKAINH